MIYFILPENVIKQSFLAFAEGMEMQDRAKMA